MRQCSNHTQVPLNSCDQTREDTEEAPDTVSESAGQGGNQPRPSTCKMGSRHYFSLSWCEDSFRDNDSSLDHFLKENYYRKDCSPVSVPGPQTIWHGLPLGPQTVRQTTGGHIHFQTEIKAQKGLMSHPNPPQSRGWV